MLECFWTDFAGCAEDCVSGPPLLNLQMWATDDIGTLGCPGPPVPSSSVFPSAADNVWPDLNTDSVALSPAQPMTAASPTVVLTMPSRSIYRAVPAGVTLVGQYCTLHPYVKLTLTMPYTQGRVDIAATVEFLDADGVVVSSVNPPVTTKYPNTANPAVFFTPVADVYDGDGSLRVSVTGSNFVVGGDGLTESVAGMTLLVGESPCGC